MGKERYFLLKIIIKHILFLKKLYFIFCYKGFGKYYYPDGDRYEGLFSNNKREGKGVYFYIDGSRYEGEFKNGI